MTNFPSDTYVFGSAHYRPVIDSLQQRVPIPRAPIVGDWVHIGYSSVNIFETDGGVSNVSWQLRIVMPTLADYTAMVALVGSFATLTADFTTPAGAVLLRSLEGAQQHSNAFSAGAGWYTATATFEWSTT